MASQKFREMGPVPPPPPVRLAEISRQRCFMCATQLEVLEECFIHRVQPVAICKDCSVKVNDAAQLAPAVVVGDGDASDLPRNEIAARNLGRSREGEERVA